MRDATECVRRELDEQGHEGVAVDEVFSDEGLSERVRGGRDLDEQSTPLDQPRASEPWLPPRECGLRVDGKNLSIRPEELPEAQRCLDEAIERGEPSANINGVDVPANSESRTAIEELIRRTQPPDSSSPGDDPTGNRAIKGGSGDGPSGHRQPRND